MKIFSNDVEIKGQLEAATAENEELTALVSQREEEIKGLSEKVAELSAGIEEQAALLLEAQNAATALEAEKVELTEKLTASEEAQTEFDTKVANAASAQMAELGVKEPVETVEEEEGDDIFAKYRKLQESNPRQATEFWNENKAALLAQR